MTAPMLCPPGNGCQTTASSGTSPNSPRHSRVPSSSIASSSPTPGFSPSTGGTSYRFILVSSCPPSPLHGARRQPRDELLLQQQEQEDDRQDAQQRAGHQHAVRLLVHADHLVQADGKREPVRVVQDDLRPEEAV